jgi:phage RecT family recombinase
MARLALTSLRTVRGLAECTPASIMACVMTASQLGLEPGVLGSCYLIPRKGEATFLIGYQGLLDLIRRSGKVTSIASRVVLPSALVSTSLLHHTVLRGHHHAATHIGLSSARLNAELLLQAPSPPTPTTTTVAV